MKTLRPFRPGAANRGSALIVALIFGTVIAICLTSFIRICSTAQKLANRSFYLNAAQNLADTGLEYVLGALNSSSWAGAGFAVRSGYATQYQGTFPTTSPNYYDFGQGVKGVVKVWVESSGANPHAVARAIITLGDGTTIEKVAEAYLKRSSYFTNGMTSRQTITFTGNVAVDSWNSDPDNNSSTAAVAYSSSVDTDGGRIASTSVAVDSITVGNADVYGYAAIATSDLSGLDVGSTGRVGPYGTGNGVIDTSRVTYDFTTSFPDVTAPPSASVSQSYTIAAITNDETLPISGHTAASDGKYYYYVPSIDIAGTKVVNITAGTNVVLIVTGTSGTTVKMAGNSAMNIPTGSTLSMYVAGDIAITGNGIVNGGATTPNQPASFQLYGTRTAADAAIAGKQAMEIKGNGYLSGVAYTPNANVRVTGNGETYGAVVANQVNMVGNGGFHYDESLANLATSNLWGLLKWRELTTASQRATYSSHLSF